MTILISLVSVVCAGIWLCVAWRDGIENTRIGRRLSAWYWTRVRR